MYEAHVDLATHPPVFATVQVDKYELQVDARISVVAAVSQVFLTHKFEVPT